MSRWIEIDTSLLKTVSVGGLSAKALWKRIMEQPTIDIVRCKECKHNNYCCRHISPPGRKPDDFCSYGERKSDE